jgi:peptidoglycan/LPS O-acetylase OafA/YrhL
MNLHPVSLIPFFIAIGVAFLTCVVLGKLYGKPPTQGRFVAVDGLRGYLALSVFLHHSVIWYYYLHTSQWDLPPSRFYIHLGQSSVALFFMITAFLFFSKIMDARKTGIDWTKLLVGRVMRLGPLYLFAMAIMLTIIAWTTRGQIRVPASSLAKAVASWLSFSIPGRPDINTVPGTLVTSGVTWSLVYEWFFYLALPALALLFRAGVPLLYVGLSAASIAAVPAWGLELKIAEAFLGGMVASVLVRSETFCRYARKGVFSLVILGCGYMVVTDYGSAFERRPLALLSLIFVLIAAGNDLFGMLSRAGSRVLGELAYGIYLLHGILLFTTFQLLLQTDVVRAMSPEVHWLLIMALTVALILICFATFRWIETPGMRCTGKVTDWLRERLSLRSKRPSDILPSAMRRDL